MILEYFENNKNNSIEYNEESAMFKIKIKNNKNLFNIFGLGNMSIYEKDSSINTINQLKQEADKTTLTEDDINVLYNFAKRGFNYKGSIDAFKNDKLKDIFVGMDEEQLSIHKLAPMAYDYTAALQRGETPIIEKFTNNSIINKLQSKSKTNKIMTLISMLSLSILCLLIVLFCIYLLYK